MRRPSWRTILPGIVLVPVVAALSPRLLRRARPLARAALARTTGHPLGSQPRTPASLAAELWGEDQAGSQSPGAQRVRTAARELFPKHAPGHGGEWRFTAAQAARLRAHFDEE